MASIPATRTRKLRGPSYRGPLGALSQYRRDPLSLFYDQAVAHGGSVRIRLAHEHVHLLVDPEHIRRVLTGNAANYVKGISYASLSHLLGNGLLTSDGDLWQRQRALIKPAFGRHHTAAEIPLIMQCGYRLVERLDAKANSGEAFDLVPELMCFALDVVCRAAMGSDVDHLLPQIERDTPAGEQWIMRNMASVMALPPSVPTPANLRFNRVRARMREVVERVIEGHRHGDADPNSFLGRLLKARDDSGHAMDDRQLRDEVLTFLLAGHETSAAGAAWTIYELCQHPQWVRAVADEVNQSELDGPGASEAALGLKVTGRVVDESMRLHPPAWAFTRTAVAADSFDDFDIAKGSIVVISPFVNHRMPQFWSAPLRFDPNRFTEDQVRARPRLHYFPFGFGPHLCVGMHFAVMEMRIAIALLVSQFDIELVNGMRVRENPQIANTPDPVMVRITRRKDKP
jgi:cytochrome P450